MQMILLNKVVHEKINTICHSLRKHFARLLSSHQATHPFVLNSVCSIKKVITKKTQPETKISSLPPDLQSPDPIMEVYRGESVQF